MAPLAIGRCHVYGMTDQQQLRQNGEFGWRLATAESSWGAREILKHRPPPPPVRDCSKLKFLHKLNHQPAATITTAACLFPLIIIFIYFFLPKSPFLFFSFFFKFNFHTIFTFETTYKPIKFISYYLYFFLSIILSTNWIYL